MLFFDFRSIEFRMGNPRQGLMVKGEIINKTGQSYSAVVFRVVVFAKNSPLGNTTMVINGFNAGQMKTFETSIIDLQDKKIIPSITRCEIFAESAY